MVRSGRLEVILGGGRVKTGAHECRRAAVGWRFTKHGSRGIGAHEVLEIAASLAMGRAAIRTIVPRLHLGHWNGSIPVSCWHRCR